MLLGTQDSIKIGPFQIGWHGGRIIEHY
jgi:hypothetical protein